MMGKTAWGQEFDAKLEAWNEVDKLKRENKGLKAERDELMAQVEVLKDAANAAYCNWRSSSDVFGAMQKLMQAVEATPIQCLNQIKAETLIAEAMLWPEDKYTECSHVRESILESAKHIQRGEL